MSSRSRMLKRGRRRLMKLCSASSASASVAVTRHSIRSIREVRRESPPEKCEPMRLRIERALAGDLGGNPREGKKFPAPNPV